MSVKYILNDITKLKVDAIVNTTNASLNGSGGVDYAIHLAAGELLYQLTSNLEKLETSKAIITPGFNLPCKYIIHTVGPIYIDGKYNEVQLLYQTYQNVLKLALENDVKTIAFPLISAGSHRFPKQLAIEVATVAINEFLETHDMIFTKDLELGIIDFDKMDIADPIDDFKPFVSNVKKSTAFETGLIDGYHNNNVPESFFQVLALYAAESCIGLIPW